MAAIHDLLAQIQDEALRERIEKEVNKLSKTTGTMATDILTTLFFSNLITME